MEMEQFLPKKESKEIQTILSPAFKEKVILLINSLRNIMRHFISDDQFLELIGSTEKMLLQAGKGEDPATLRHDSERAAGVINRLITEEMRKMATKNLN